MQFACDYTENTAAQFCGRSSGKASMSSTLSDSQPPGPVYAPPPVAVVWAARTVAFIGASLAGYLAWASIAAGGKVAGCSDQSGFDCAGALASRWSQWFGLPVALTAVFVYLALFAALLGIGPASTERTERAAWRWIVPLATLAAGAASWFSALQLFAIHSMCPYCMGVHGCGIALAAFAFWYLPLRASAGPPWHAEEPALLRPQTAGLLVVLGLCGVAALITGQALGTAPQRDVEVTETPMVEAFVPIDRAAGSTTSSAGTEMPVDDAAASVVPTASPLTAESSGTQPDESSASSRPAGSANDAGRHRRIALMGGKASVDAHELPILGSPDAESVLVELFDYTCPHCRELHRLMQQARERYQNRLAVVLLPNPMNTRCNQYVKVDQQKHKEACDYARLALAVWYAKPAAFETFHDRLMETSDVPAVEQARKAAESLITPAELERALANEAIDRQISANGLIYHLAGHGEIPKLMNERYIIAGHPKDAEAFFQLLEKRFGLPP
jgi:uncharacterized membrane protein